MRSVPHQVEIEVAYVRKSCQMIDTVGQKMLGLNWSLTVHQVRRSASICAWQRKY